ncbi:hypothetical protein [Halococcus hamelinensis]|uniref:Uncharacterized protein n=1 Tax=Halococcus hamelinensis 100A6 TaxID=1132509 RepID=M0MBL8_9EURY|nr:hypothetical protein [Halococcus hamelinensis]EMA42009.1 hypothetical protein C447_00425 [Halococcus hamelinensis 100A6]
MQSNATESDTVDHQARKNRLNISDHTSVLGVDILAHPQAEYALMHDVYNQGGLGAEPELWTWRGEMLDKGCRAELAAWARRTIFSFEGGHTE